jgi:hypothetical protein
MSLIVFEKFELDYPVVRFRYRLNGAAWSRTLDLGDLPRADVEAAPADAVANLLAHIGISLARYFFIIEDFDRLHIEPINLPDEALASLERWFQLTLAEMRYRNGLQVGKKTRITCAPDAPMFSVVDAVVRDEALLMNGGGKDSAVAAEILKAVDVPFTWLTVEKPAFPAMARTVRASGRPNHLHVGLRCFNDDMKAAASYRSHINETLSLPGLLAALVGGYRYLIVANEYSANFGNFTHDGVRINHQFGKSTQSIRAVSRYVERYIVRGLHYFSVLSPLYEIQIGKLFSRHPQYFGEFLSCNEGLRQDAWCGRCSKCAFIFLLLAAYLPTSDLVSIFGRNLFESPEFHRWLEALAGGRKPFECVGTRKESQLALHMALQRHLRPAAVTPADWERLTRLCAELDVAAAQRGLLQRWCRRHTLPPGLEAQVMDYFARQFAC